MKMKSARSKHLYQIGDVARDCDLASSKSSDDVVATFLLKEGDGAFIVGTDLVWRYAIVTEVHHPYITFDSGPTTETIHQDCWTNQVRSIEKQEQTIYHHQKKRATTEALNRLFISSCLSGRDRHPDPVTYRERMECCLKHLREAGCLDKSPFESSNGIGPKA